VGTFGSRPLVAGKTWRYVMRSKHEIDGQIEISYDFEERYSGMSYADGVRNALDWVTGYSDDPPFDPEDLD
jgi:hypothetical protein